MVKNKRRPLFVKICLISFFVLILCRIDFAQAFTLGKTYDSKNWQEMEGIAPPFLVNWVKSGEFILGTEELQFEFEIEKAFLEASQKNLGKFDINEEGFIVHKKACKPPEFIYGLPFPRIDTQAPEAGGKIMANHLYAQMRLGGIIRPNETSWIGKGGLERIMVAVSKRFNYQGHPGGPIKNNDNFLYQGMMNVVKPMSLKDVVKMHLVYNDFRQDTSFSYVAALRRFQRTSSSARSEAMFGSDMCVDDSELWGGKNSTFNWRLIGEKKVLCGFAAPDKIVAADMPDGAFKCVFPRIKLGYMDSNGKEAPWTPLNVTWSLRPVWVVEGIPKDPEYNYGKQLFYVDKGTFTFWFKEIYDRSGQYWKAIFGIQGFQVAPDGRTSLLHLDAYLAIDDRIRHATFYRELASSGGADNLLYCPISMLGPKNFNINAVQQLSK